MSEKHLGKPALQTEGLSTERSQTLATWLCEDAPATVLVGECQCAELVMLSKTRSSSLARLHSENGQWTAEKPHWLCPFSFLWTQLSIGSPQSGLALALASVYLAPIWKDATFALQVSRLQTWILNWRFGTRSRLWACRSHLHPVSLLTDRHPASHTVSPSGWIFCQSLVVTFSKKEKPSRFLLCWSWPLIKQFFTFSHTKPLWSSYSGDRMRSAWAR